MFQKAPCLDTAEDMYNHADVLEQRGFKFAAEALRKEAQQFDREFFSLGRKNHG